MTETSSVYLCPVCQRNRSKFELIYKLTQEIVKDEQTGAVIFKADEFESPIHADGRPDIDVKCSACSYVASESIFVGAARRDNAAIR